ncbi:MAG: 2-hydroxyacyl-CoA dehydratase [Firmicutes bacterium]|nr:2-hydroxyacyl-CoA dehydratase [Bacillota bacterium]
MIDYICKYSPIEIFAGFGEDANLLNPVSVNFEKADTITHRNICSFSRAVIEKRLSETKNPVIFSKCCDSLTDTADVLENLGQKVFILELPHTNTHCSINIYADELKRLVAELEEYYGRKFDAVKFRGAFKSENNSVPGEHIALMGARMSPEIVEYIEKRSPYPIRNNSCTNLRSLPECPDTEDFDELMNWYARALMNQTPCMRMADISDRKKIIESPDLKGIIYSTVSFCDYYGFEYAALKNLDVPMLKIETDYTLNTEGQMLTRLEAFFENMKVDEKMEAVKKEGYTAGVDSGSTSTNAVILDKDKNIVSFSVVPTGVKVSESAERALNEAIKKAGLNREDITAMVSTGYGRGKIEDRQKDVTEITCHAKGAYFLNNNIRTVIDIGGQDSKVIRMDENGNVIDFAMNDKCAAGTGRFIEMMAQSLGLDMDQMSTKGLEWNENIVISSMCSVFAQSEVVSLIASDKKLEDIVHGLNRSVAAKVLALGNRNKMQPEYMMSGGVAKNKGVVKEIENMLGVKLNVPDEPEILGALGAALIASEM